MKRYKLYWIYDNRKLADPTTDGYIGVTTRTVSDRLLSHKTQLSGNHNGSSRKMYEILKDIPFENIGIKEICWSASEDTMCAIEKAFRPTTNIGWNVHPGGKKIGRSKKFHVIYPDGKRVAYNTQYEAAMAGFNQGHISLVLRDIKKTFRSPCGQSCTAEYVL